MKVIIAALLGSGFVTGIGLWHRETTVLVTGIVIGAICLVFFWRELKEAERQAKAEAAKKANERILRLGEEALDLIQVSLRAQLPDHTVCKGSWGRGTGLCLDVVANDAPDHPVMSVNLDGNGIFVRLFAHDEDITGSLSALRAFGVFLEENQRFLYR